MERQRRAAGRLPDAVADEGEDGLDPTMVIVRAMWQKLQDTHVQRLVKQ